MRRFLEFFDIQAPGSFKFTRVGGKTSDVWESPAGLHYAITDPMSPGTGEFHRINHVLTHGVPGWRNKAEHTVFAKANGQRLDLDEIPKLVDEAWSARPAQYTDISAADEWYYRIPMGKTVGMGGEDHLIIFVKPNTSEIQSAYACFSAYAP